MFPLFEAQVNRLALFKPEAEMPKFEVHEVLILLKGRFVVERLLAVKGVIVSQKGWSIQMPVTKGLGNS